MKTIQVYDKPMCCSTGVCGPQVDPVLPRFAADLEWLKSQGHVVERYNLAQEPLAFTKNPEVQQLLTSAGVECLPLIAINGQMVSQGGYPSRESLALWTGSRVHAEAAAAPGKCCGGSKCC